MVKTGRLLIVDDNCNILSAVKLLAGKLFEDVITLSSPNTLISTIQRSAPNVVLLDMNFYAGINTGNEGIFWLKEIQTKFPDVKVVLFTAYADIELAVRAMKEGAFDFDYSLLKITLPDTIKQNLAFSDAGRKTALEFSKGLMGLCP